MGIRASSMPFGDSMYSTELKGLTLGDSFWDERGREFCLFQLDVTTNLTGSTVAQYDVMYLLAPLVVNNKLSAATGGAQNYVISAGIATVAIAPISGSTLYVLLLQKGRSLVTTGSDTSTAGAYVIIDTGNSAKAKTVAQTDTTTQTLDLIPRHIGRSLVTVASGTTTDTYVNITLGLR